MSPHFLLIANVRSFNFYSLSYEPEFLRLSRRSSLYSRLLPTPDTNNSFLDVQTFACINFCSTLKCIAVMSHLHSL